jgi:hypothetical protein
MSVIVTTFGGRRDRMELLVRYVVAALESGIVSAYHVWDYARTEGDRRWLRDLPRRHPAIQLFTPRPDPARYGAYYRHYRRDQYRDTVFLKADDDVVYLQLDRLAELIAFRRAHAEFFLVSANLVNNGVCAYFQQQRGVVPASVMDLPYPARGYCGTLWERADLAERLHDYFLDLPQRFVVPGVDVAPDRLSINCVAYLGADVDELRQVGEDDEEELSVTIPRRLGRQNVIYQPAVAAHLSFFSQEPGMDVARLLARYRALADTVLE